jgi:hypothetical protein
MKGPLREDMKEVTPPGRAARGGGYCSGEDNLENLEEDGLIRFSKNQRL